MKSNTKKRLIAFMLCMVLVLSSATSAFADEGSFYHVPNDTVELSREIMKDGISQGTLYATIPGEAFQASDANANLQMDLQTETDESAIIENIQTELINSGITEYALNQTIMADISFFISTEVNAQVPTKPINFRFENTSLDTTLAMGFVYDRSDNTTTLYDLNDNTLQFEQDVDIKADTIVVGCFDLIEKATDTSLSDEENNIVEEDSNVSTTAATDTGYSITTKNPSGVTITVQHYLENENDPLYQDSNLPLTTDKKYDNLASLTNYQAVKVVKVNNGTAESDPISGNITLTTNQTFRVYYRPTTGTILKNPVQMFDYTINKKNEGINSPSNYSASSTNDTRLASGTTGDGCSDYNATVPVPNKEPYYINAWDRNSENKDVNRDNNRHVYGSNDGGTAFAAKGIITGIDSSGALKMGKDPSGKQLYEPGYFSPAEKEGKTIYNDQYKLTFNRSGDTYTLSDVTDATASGTKISGYNKESGANFFPLDDLGTYQDSKNNTSDYDNKKHNDYFGMRYDITFRLGDYLGDLNYKFKGDDDLWVILDVANNGGTVVLDIGGIHTAIEDSVDLWAKLLGNNNYKLQNKIDYLNRDDDNDGVLNKDEEHTLTILYMERGASQSNCKMNFTLPNSTVVTPNQIATADLKLTKVTTSDKAIAKAQFKLVNDHDTNDAYTITSSEDGKITFDKLKEGNTYTLTEASVPSPYVPETTQWKVKLEGNPLKAVLYDSTGTTAQTLNNDGTYHIQNRTQEEIVSGNVESNKTVSVENYANRTYKIDLTASSKVTQAVTTTTPYDIVMVLDTSGSMSNPFYKYTEYTGNLNYGGPYYIKTDDKIYQQIKYSRKGYWYYKNTDGTKVRVTQETNTIYTRANDSTTKNAALKAAAKAFVENVNTKNPDSRIGIVKFASGSTINNSGNKTMLRVGNSKSTIDGWIDNLGTYGATNTAAGFRSAKEIFDNPSNWADVHQNQNRKKLIVFLTDGVPTTSSDFSESVATSTVTTATTLKGASYNAEIYSLGIFDAADYEGDLGDNATIKKVSKFMKDVASDDSKYMTADSVQSLYDIFNSITDNMPTSVTATITDVIDSRFELISGEKSRLEGSGATVTTSNGITTVTWIATTVNSTPEWHETIHIKAKDDFIGGNMIPTNGSTSGITIDGNTKPFPQPSVNVKLLTPSIGNKEKTYYKGDTIESSNFSGELLGTYEITELDGTTKLTAGSGIPQLTSDQLNNLKAGGTVEIPYSYTNSATDIEGTFVYKYENKKCESDGSIEKPLENHTATKAGQDVEEYTLKVTFIPKTVDDRKTSLGNTSILSPNGNADISGTIVVNDEKTTVTGNYKVHVLALWAIVKQSTSKDSNGNHPKLDGAEFKLVKSDDSTVCYTGISNKDGFVEWYKDNTEISMDKIENGIYTLKETKAPAGYAKSEVKWTIEITNTSITIKDDAGKNITATSLTQTGKTYDAYAYENTPVYDLPSTGGNGIYLYMIGGILLMFAAAWILYKNKCREVLER